MSTYSKENLFHETLAIPSHKPDLYRIMDFIILPDFSSYTALSTPKGLSFEGQSLSGVKVLAYISLKLKLTYIANTSPRTTHSIEYDLLRSMSLDFPEHVGEKNSILLIDTGHLSLNPIVTSIFIKSLNSRTLYFYTDIITQCYFS